MPLATLAQVGFELEVTFAALDTNSKIVTRKKRYEVTGAGADDAARFADAKVNALAFIAELADVTEALITGTRLSEILATADAVVQVATPHKEAVLTLQGSASSIKKLTHTIPAPADAILVNGSTVNAGNADVAAYLATFMIGGGDMRMSDGETIAATNPLLESRVRMVSSGKTF